MERPRIASLAWGGLVAGISAYELLCPQGETLSEGLDSHMEKRWKQLALLGAGAVTLAHLANILPECVDPFERGLSPIRQRYRRVADGRTNPVI